MFDGIGGLAPSTQGAAHVSPRVTANPAADPAAKTEHIEGVVGKAVDKTNATGSGPVKGTHVAVEPGTSSVLVFDVETTGTDRKRDQVIELCVQFGMSGEGGQKTWRFLPTVEISPGAQAVHGISMDDLRGCPSFAETVDEILAVFASCNVIAGYNVSFDIDMVQSELERAGRGPLDLSNKLIIDPFRLWQQCEPRSLQHAHKRFVGGEFESAHSATADVAATGRVLGGMLAAFGLADKDWSEVADVCDPSRQRCIGPSRHFMWNDQGAITIAFGKHAGTLMTAMVKGEGAGYLRWVQGRDFPAHVCDICEAALSMDAESFVAWVISRFGPPPTV